MEIRFEKVEIKIPEEVFETVIGGVLRLKNLDIELRSRADNARSSIMAAVATAIVSKLGDILETMKASATKATNGKSDTDEETQEPAPVGHGG